MTVELFCGKMFIVLYVFNLFPDRMFITPTGLKRNFAWTATTMRTPSPKTSTPSTATATWERDPNANECQSQTPNANWIKPKRRVCWENLQTKSSSTLPSNPEGRGTITTAPTSVNPTHSCQPSRHWRRGPIRIHRFTRRRRSPPPPPPRCCRPGWSRGRSSLSVRSAGRKPSLLFPEQRLASVGSR